MFTVNQLINNCPNWNKYINHQFVKELANENLNNDKFQKFLMQDFIYLFNYGKVFSLLSTKANSINEFHFAIKNIKSIESELCILHKKYYSNVNIKDLKITKECKNYIDFLYQISQNSTYLELLIALIPCAVGYYFIGQNLFYLLQKNPNHKYRVWIETYNTINFKNTIDEMFKFVNQWKNSLSPSEIIKLQEMFNNSVNLEIIFFNMGLK